MGQTLGVWAGTTNGGPYIVLPLLGPSNLRDVFGRGIDMATDPWDYIGQGDTVRALRITRTATQVIDTREQLIEPIDELRQRIDPYAALRSVYQQQRARDILDESPPRRRFFDWRFRPPE
jgi:phospholipid-binding lipoprotein MlaA